MKKIGERHKTAGETGPIDIPSEKKMNGEGVEIVVEGGTAQWIMFVTPAA